MLFVKAAIGGLLGKRGVLENRCFESYQVNLQQKSLKNTYEEDHF